jgi:hypothetical protein
MTCHCDDALKAQVYISPPVGEQIIVLSEYPPTCYEITEESICWEYGGEGLTGNCQPSGSTFTHFHRGEKPKFETKTSPQGTNFAGCNFSYVVLNGKSNFPSYEGGGAPGTTFVRRVEGENCSTQAEGPGFVVTVTDESGTIYENFFPGQESPTVEVACDDNCPEGYLKCASNKHPGYCCLPCKETANKIRALGTKL